MVVPRHLVQALGLRLRRGALLLRNSSSTATSKMATAMTTTTTEATGQTTADNTKIRTTAEARHRLQTRATRRRITTVPSQVTMVPREEGVPLHRWEEAAR